MNGMRDREINKQRAEIQEKYIKKCQLLYPINNIMKSYKSLLAISLNLEKINDFF